MWSGPTLSNQEISWPGRISETLNQRSHQEKKKHIKTSESRVLMGFILTVLSVLEVNASHFSWCWEAQMVSQMVPDDHEMLGLPGYQWIGFFVFSVQSNQLQYSTWSPCFHIFFPIIFSPFFMGSSLFGNMLELCHFDWILKLPSISHHWSLIDLMVNSQDWVACWRSFSSLMEAASAEDWG